MSDAAVVPASDEPSAPAPVPADTNDFEHVLRNLPAAGTLVKDRPYRQVWRFEHAGRAYYLKFYPRHGVRDRIRRFGRGSPAYNEFRRLQMLQKARVPSPRAVSFLSGLTVVGRAGDAVVLEAIEPAITLQQMLLEHDLAATPVPHRRQLAEQVTNILRALGRAKLGHEDLHLGNFLVSNDRVFLIDGYAVRPPGMGGTGGIRLGDLFLLGHAAAPFATCTEFLRAWRALRLPGEPPAANPRSPRIVRQLAARSLREDRCFGQIALGDFAGNFVKHATFARPWSAASQLTVSADDWRRCWPTLWRQIQHDELPVLKRSGSGDVLAGEVTLAGRAMPIIIKRPRRRYWYRYINEIGRGSRSRRAWLKAWRAIARDLPTAWPLLMLEQRVAGYVVDQLIIFERVPGPTLADAKLDAMSPDARDRLFRRAGRTLRRIESFGWSHFDAKASNWIAMPSPGSPADAPGDTPVLIDIDGIRRRRWTALGIRRLLRSLKEKRPRYTPADSRALCEGYAPWAQRMPGQSHGNQPT